MGGTLIERFRAARRDERLAVLEGFHAIKHALRFGARVEDVAALDGDLAARLCEQFAPDLAGRLASRILTVDASTFSLLAPTRIHTGVIAVARRPPVDVAAALAAPSSAPVVLLENARSPYNVGASVRVAAAAGAAGLFVTGSTDPWLPAALRAGAGLAFALPVARVAALPPSDRPLVAVDPEGEVLPGELPARAILAFGTERDGLSDDLRSAADIRVRIPMRAGVSSLNLATAVAALLYRA